MKYNSTIAIIGSGNMGAGLITGLIADGYPADKLWVADLATDKLEQLKKQFGIHTTTDNKQAVSQADIVIFAVKPQILPSVATELATLIKQHQSLVISIAAGVRVKSIEHCLGTKTAIVRAMPNMPALIGCGATALFANTHVTSEQRNNAESILRAVGLVVWLKDEKLLDAVTALSGSGPAYFFLFMEILQEVGEQMGLPKDIARLLTLQTGFGAARMALESEQTLAELRKQVTSPNGTTEKALHVLEQKNIRDTLTAAVLAAAQRSEELAVQFDQSMETKNV